MIESTNLISDLNDCMRSWKQFMPDLKFLCHYSLHENSIIIDLIHVPVNRRRKGICGDIVCEVLEIAQIHQIPTRLLPDEYLGTPLNVLYKMYKSYGFVNETSGWMFANPKPALLS